MISESELLLIKLRIIILFYHFFEVEYILFNYQSKLNLDPF